MGEIILAGDDLKRLEKCLGSTVHYMGPWHSDGVFGYCTVRITDVEKAVDALNDPALMDSLQQLKAAPEPTTQFIKMVQGCGTPLVKEIVAAHQRRFQMRFASAVRSASSVA